jgi:hypothetical protein
MSLADIPRCRPIVIFVRDARGLAAPAIAELGSWDDRFVLRAAGDAVWKANGAARFVEAQDVLGWAELPEMTPIDPPA